MRNQFEWGEVASFDMGGEASDELPIHRVTLKSFAIGKTEITQAQWKAVMGDYYFYNNNKRILCLETLTDNCPVNMISWTDTKLFISKLNVITGKSYRLPSESEWEYSCRAGGRHVYCGGDNLATIATRSTFFTDFGAPKAVAGRNPNAWGLYDMSGNVYEWTEDCWNSNYNGAPADGSAWTSSGDCSARVVRGGAIRGPESHLRSGVRPTTAIKNVQSRAFLTFGFRIVRDN